MPVASGPSSPAPSGAASGGAAAGSGVAYLGQATFRGCVGLIDLPRGAAAQILPAELELASPEGEASHPLAVAFGDFDDSTAIVGTYPIRLGVRYHETCSAVPRVRFKGGHETFTFVFRMYCDHLGPMMFGNANYGLGKQIADLGWVDSEYLVSEPKGPALVRFGFEVGKEAVPDGLERVMAPFRAPVVGRKRSGDYAACRFDWDFSRAITKELDLAMTVVASVDSLSAGVYRSVPGCGFALDEVLWRISWPMPAR